MQDFQGNIDTILLAGNRSNNFGDKQSWLHKHDAILLQLGNKLCAHVASLLIRTKSIDKNTGIHRDRCPHRRISERISTELFFLLLSLASLARSSSNFSHPSSSIFSGNMA